MSISIKELAKIAKVSPTTVVRALKDKPDVSEETRQRIVDLAEKHNYRPNILAQSLVSGRTYTIGIIVPDITNPFFPALIKGTEAALWKAGYNVILADTDYSNKKEKQTICDFISRQVDGLIVSPIDTAGHSGWFDVVASAAVPTVSVTKLDSLTMDTVIAADCEGSKIATRHLISLGRKRILYIGNTSGEWANEERINGYKESLKEAGLPLDEKLIVGDPHGNMDTAYEEIRGCLDVNLEFDAVLAFDDVMAIGVKKALSEHGLRIPEDVSLVGFDNIQFSSLPDISLTTIDIPKYEIGQKSAELLLSRIDEKNSRKDKKANPNYKFEEIVLTPNLIIRKSCGGSEGS